MGLLNPAGGPSYHLKALLFSRHWTIFQQDIQRWLEGWGPPKREIMLIGPSAGYNLPVHWISSFQKRSGIDPDPFARATFRLKHGPVEWLKYKWFCVDYSSKSALFPINHLEKLCHENPKCPILFCNILGQIPVLYRKEVRNNPKAFAKWKSDFSNLMKKRTFASFHDIYSADRNFVLLGSDYEWTVGSNVIDHQISDLFSDFSDRCYFKWPLTPKSHHLIEGVRHLVL